MTKLVKSIGHGTCNGSGYRELVQVDGKLYAFGYDAINYPDTDYSCDTGSYDDMIHLFNHHQDSINAGDFDCYRS